MYTIGIIDITTVGSTICQRRINELGGATGDHPEFCVYSIPFIQYRDALINENWDTVATLISRSIQQLEKLGVDFIINPSNTPHYAYEEYTKAASVPVLNLIEITAEACKQAGLKKVAILGTQATMSGGLYKEKLENKNIELITPKKETSQAIHDFIIEEIIPGRVNPATRDKALKLIKETIDCDGFILGCTELPEVYSSSDLGKTAIDTTRLLAEVAFDVAKNEDNKTIEKYSQK